MPEIACLGWGSLTWRPGNLPIRQPWRKDGPQVCVDFLRQSDSGLITLILDGSAAPVTSLWAEMQTHDIGEAITSLRRRERIPLKDEKKSIGVWRPGDASPRLVPDLAEWAKRLDLNAVIWTNLGPKFDRVERLPSVDEVIGHLKGLTGQVLVKAEEYVRRAPVQVNTVYRRQIEAALGWTPSDKPPRQPG
jgi:hypothetical protein